MASKAASKFRRYLTYLVCILAVLLIFPLRQSHKRFNEHEHMYGLRARCAIALGNYRSQKLAYSTGYNYELLQKAASILEWNQTIELMDSTAIDSLENCAIDLLVLPQNDSVLNQRHNLFSSIALEDSTVWVINSKGQLSLSCINSTLLNIASQPGYEKFTERFRPKYEPFSRAAKGYTYKNASPYDSLFTVASASLGWDWHLLAALVWQESRFRIDAQSRKGASGLMQMMPSTAQKYNGSTETLNPELNLKAATGYLLKLQKMFTSYAADPEELTRFTLAAYNAGEGRLLDCIKFARSRGLDGSRWEEIKNVIPLMKDDDLLDSAGVKLGRFKGRETIAYIEITDSLCKAFRQIKP